MQKHVNLVDLVKSFPTNIYLQNLASIQKRTSPIKFAHLAKKSGKGSISNLSTKVHTESQSYPYFVVELEDGSVEEMPIGMVTIRCALVSPVPTSATAEGHPVSPKS